MNVMNPNPNAMQLLGAATGLMSALLQSNGMGMAGGGCPGCQQLASINPMDGFAGSPGLGNAGGPAGAIPNFGSSFGGPQGASPMGGADPMGGLGANTGSGGADAAARAVDVAQKFQGQPSQSLKGKLPGFTAPGGATNNCAAFVSACLETTGALPKGGGSASVSALRGKLNSAGWKKVPAQQAPKGAVWMTKEGRGSHTELVASPGGKTTIGSNNNGQKGFQRISQRPKNTESGEYWAPPGAASGGSMMA